jgi:hypothetical protein
MTYTPKPELLWRADPAVDAARKLPDWAKFHRACGVCDVFYDHIERHGRGYRCTVFTRWKENDLWYHRKLADGDGKTVVEALADAYRKSGITVPGADEMLTHGLLGVADEFEDLF